MRPRLADIASHVGVSQATVSRVLNGKPGVAERTREAVLTALDVLGYERPARLRQRPGGLVGLVVPELADPVLPALVEAVGTALTRDGYTPALRIQAPGGLHEEDHIRSLAEHGVSGIVFVSGAHADATADVTGYLRLREGGLPLAFVNGFVPGVDASFVSTDDRVGVELAVGHLAALGHRRIGLAVGPDRFVRSRRRIAGFREAVRRHLGIDVPEDWTDRSLSGVEGGAAAAGRLVDAGCTAVVCGSDLMALGAVRQLRDRGLRVPGDVSVVGFDDTALVAFADPPLTTLRQAVESMGSVVVRVLLDEIEGTAAPRTEYLFRPELVVRSSTGPVPAARPATPHPVAAHTARTLPAEVRGVSVAAAVAHGRVVDLRAGAVEP